MTKIIFSIVVAIAVVVPQITWSALSHFDVFEKKCRILLTNPENLSDETRLEKFMVWYWDYLMHDDPEWATYTSYPGLNGELADMSLNAIKRRDDLAALTLKTLASLNREKLSGKNRLNLDLLTRDTRLDIALNPFPGEFLAISQMSGVHQDITELIRNMPHATLKDYEDTLSRLDKAQILIGQTITLLQKGIEQKIVAPKIPLRDLEQQVLDLVTEDPLQSPLLEPFTNFPAGIPAEQQTQLTARAREIYTQKIRPALLNLHDFLKNTYIPHCRNSVGLGALPNGKEWYDLLIKSHTTTQLTADEIHNIGLSEIQRIRSEMEKIKTQLGFSGTIKDFFDFVRSNPHFFFDKKEDLLMAYRDIAKRADPELVKLFGRLPRLPYGVVPIPAYSEKSQTTAYYQPGSLATGLPGLFYANTYDLKSRPKWEMEALTLHEAVPGHHLQISIAKELEDLPEFRKEADYTAYIEGWGLYAESLGEEIGFYRDPYSKFGQLTYEMWRAIRLVVDTGLHAKGWTREEAIAFFEENAGKASHDITVEVDRYIVWPGQALAYKIGQLKFRELRDHAAKKLGDKFDLRAFHDEILGQGALPLDVVEAQVKEWLERQ